ncbi:unnamed protein product [Didymodactylos carnosus]|uniref:Reverse transcriptase domain-containing protein n=1 Tax=Didymodactylos carnosus TaxID=1234261 RepID=A0A814PG44_9BILA|nr:unnamed protein product [Didymodactylos carnosus]CAF1105900.1 unnamed protein product [Didymodactylos carnosus]CAF3744938.1 unnamed protein product [Didymodactylos carnosus]CAF3870582.1 unnamed protein product [Didymodactylos carnosus]
MASDLNNDLIVIEKWSQHWKLPLNISKCEAMLLTLKPVPAVLPRLYVANNPIRQSTVHKHLGLLLTIRMDWTTYIDNILLRINKLIELLKLHSRMLNRQALDVIYKSFVLPCFSYGCVVFNSTTEYNLERFQSAQYGAALAVTGAVYGSSSESILSDLGWSCIRDIFKQRRIVTYHTIIVRQKPDYLFGLIPTPTHPNLNYNLRSQSATGPQLSISKCRLEWLNIHFFIAFQADGIVYLLVCYLR